MTPGYAPAIGSRELVTLKPKIIAHSAVTVTSYFWLVPTIYKLQ